MFGGKDHRMHTCVFVCVCVYVTKQKVGKTMDCTCVCLGVCVCVCVTKQKVFFH